MDYTKLKSLKWHTLNSTYIHRLFQDPSAHQEYQIAWLFRGRRSDIDKYTIYEALDNHRTHNSERIHYVIPDNSIFFDMHHVEPTLWKFYYPVDICKLRMLDAVVLSTYTEPYVYVTELRG